MSYILAAALMPSIILLIYIYKKDKTDKEPFGLLLALFVAGVISCLPSILGETLMGSIISGAFGLFINESELEASTAYQFTSAFFGVALVEEFFKWIFMFLITRNNKNFNSLFDGLIYAVFTSLGFATLENILYVVDGGLETALLRAVTSIPGHMFFGVFMGYYYSQWQINNILITIKILLRCPILPRFAKVFRLSPSFTLFRIV